MYSSSFITNAKVLVRPLHVLDLSDATNAAGLLTLTFYSIKALTSNLLTIFLSKALQYIRRNLLCNSLGRRQHVGPKTTLHPQKCWTPSSELKIGVCLQVYQLLFFFFFFPCHSVPVILPFLLNLIYCNGNWYHNLINKREMRLFN